MQVGPSDTFSELYTKHRGEIFRYLCRMTRDLSTAEELTQDTFVRTSKGLPHFRGASKKRTWIYRIATNVYLDHRRGEPAHRPDALDASVRLTLDRRPMLPDRLLEESEMGRCIREFVDSLPPAHRAAIILHDLEGFKNAEIARILDCSLHAVKIRIHRARQKLETVLTEHCDFYRSDENVLRCDRKQSKRHSA